MSIMNLISSKWLTVTEQSFTKSTLPLWAGNHFKTRRRKWVGGEENCVEAERKNILNVYLREERWCSTFPSCSSFSQWYAAGTVYSEQEAAACLLKLGSQITPGLNTLQLWIWPSLCSFDWIINYVMQDPSSSLRPKI